MGSNGQRTDEGSAIDINALATELHESDDLMAKGLLFVGLAIYELFDVIAASGDTTETESELPSVLEPDRFTPGGTDMEHSIAGSYVRWDDVKHLFPQASDYVKLDKVAGS